MWSYDDCGFSLNLGAFSLKTQYAEYIIGKPIGKKMYPFLMHFMLHAFLQYPVKFSFTIKFNLSLFESLLQCEGFLMYSAIQYVHTSVEKSGRRPCFSYFQSSSITTWILGRGLNLCNGVHVVFYLLSVCFEISILLFCNRFVPFQRKKYDMTLIGVIVMPMIIL